MKFNWKNLIIKSCFGEKLTYFSIEFELFEV